MNDATIWFCCFALLAMGMVVGISIDSNAMTLDTFYKIFGVISGFGSLLTVFIAMQALTEWKIQFNHGERFKAFKELEVIAFSCISSIEQYWNIVKDEHMSICDEDYKISKEELSQEYMERIKNYQLHVNYAESLLTEEELNDFEYPYINFQKSTIKILQDSRDLSTSIDYKEHHNISLQIEKRILNLKQNIRCDLRSYRGR